MSVYYINFITIFIWGMIQEIIRNDKVKKAISIIISLQLFLLVVLRGNEVGADTVQYTDMFSYISELSWSNLAYTNIEKGYVLLNKILSLFIHTPHNFIVAMGIIIVPPFCYFIGKYSKKPWLSYLMFITMEFWGNSFYIYRQYIAFIILLFSLKYVLQRKLVKFCICVLIACMFHITAVVFFVIYFIGNKKINIKYIFIFTFITFFVAVFNKQIFLLLWSYARIKYEIGFIGGLHYLLVLIFMVIFTLGFSGRLSKDPKHILMTNMLLLAAMLQILSLNMTLLVRLVSYFSVSAIIIIPNIMHNILDNNKNQNYKFIIEFIVVILLLLWYINNLQGYWVSNYVFIWQ